jgi:hypothetical protein
MAAGGSVKLSQLLRDFGWTEDEPSFFPGASLAGPTWGDRKLLAWGAASGAAIDTNRKKGKGGIDRTKSEFKVLIKSE